MTKFLYFARFREEKGCLNFSLARAPNAAVLFCAWKLGKYFVASALSSSMRDSGLSVSSEKRRAASTAKTFPIPFPLLSRRRRPSLHFPPPSLPSQKVPKCLHPPLPPPPPCQKCQGVRLRRTCCYIVQNFDDESGLARIHRRGKGRRPTHKLTYFVYLHTSFKKCRYYFLLIF